MRLTRAETIRELPLPCGKVALFKGGCFAADPTIAHLSIHSIRVIFFVAHGKVVLGT